MRTERRLTTKTILGGKNVRDLVPDDGTEWLYTAMGQANAVQSGISTYGEWEALLGRFLIVTEDGEQIGGPKLILPEPVNSGLCHKVDRLYPGTGMIEFCVRVGVRKGDTATGYEYVTEIQGDEDTGTLAELAQRYKVALPAPTQEGASKPRAKRA